MSSLFLYFLIAIPSVSILVQVVQLTFIYIYTSVSAKLKPFASKLEQK